MNLDKKYATANEEIHDSNVSGMCNKYYHYLRDKEAISKLSFSDRVSGAHEVVCDAKENNVYFYRRAIDELCEDGRAGVGNFRNVNLASNDYLGFAKHPAIIHAGMAAIEKFGTGSGSVPMLVGTTSLHKELENELANFTGYDSAITYSSCYAANYGLLTTLLTSSDAAILDTSVHASIIDGCCNTNKIFFIHNDLCSLRAALIKASQYKNKLIIVDGVYSMDGDVALLDEIMQIARSNDAWVMVENRMLSASSETMEKEHIAIMVWMREQKSSLVHWEKL
jgi:7-keto-8-aminopelargonate synthetase-like enzyme